MCGEGCSRCPRTQACPAPGGQREGQPVFCGQQLSLKDPSAALGSSLRRGCGPGGCQPSDGQRQLSATLTLGLAGTTDPHLPTSPMSSSGSAVGSETLRSSCLTGQQHLQAEGWGLDPAQCPMSSWAAGLRRLYLGLLIHSLGAITFLFLGLTEPLLMNLLTVTNREVRVTPSVCRQGAHTQRSKAAVLRSHSQGGAAPGTESGLLTLKLTEARRRLRFAGCPYQTRTLSRSGKWSSPAMFEPDKLSPKTT